MCKEKSTPETLVPLVPLCEKKTGSFWFVLPQQPTQAHSRGVTYFIV